MMGRMDDQTDVKHHFIHMSRHCKALACVPSLPIAFSIVSRLYSTLSPPRRSKQTMTRQMDDRTNGQMDQGLAIINNSTKPSLGIRAIFRDDDHNSQKIKYMVPIYNHNHHKVKYLVMISNHDFQFLRLWVRGFRFWKLDNKMYLKKKFRKL